MKARGYLLYHLPEPSEFEAISSMRVIAAPDAVRRISDGGGLLFVWPRRFAGPRLVLTLLGSSLDPPAGALDFRRIDVGDFLMFLDPRLRCLPEELWVEVSGDRHARLNVYWNGLAYVA